MLDPTIEYVGLGHAALQGVNTGSQLGKHARRDTTGLQEITQLLDGHAVDEAALIAEIAVQTLDIRQVDEFASPQRAGHGTRYVVGVEVMDIPVHAPSKRSYHRNHSLLQHALYQARIHPYDLSHVSERRIFLARSEQAPIQSRQPHRPGPVRGEQPHDVGVDLTGKGRLD